MFREATEPTRRQRRDRLFVSFDPISIRISLGQLRSFILQSSTPVSGRHEFHGKTGVHILLSVCYAFNQTAFSPAASQNRVANYARFHFDVHVENAGTSGAPRDRKFKLTTAGDEETRPPRIPRHLHGQRRGRREKLSQARRSCSLNPVYNLITAPARSSARRGSPSSRL